jgi:hypothetical protein
VLRHTLRDLQIILIDDTSTDGSGPRCQEYLPNRALWGSEQLLVLLLKAPPFPRDSGARVIHLTIHR